MGLLLFLVVNSLTLEGSNVWAYHYQILLVLPMLLSVIKHPEVPTLTIYRLPISILDFMGKKKRHTQTVLKNLGT